MSESDIRKTSEVSESFDMRRETQSESEENPLEAIRRMRQQKLHACALKQKAEMEEMLAIADAKARNQDSAD